MSKYNNIKSIAIEELSDDELKDAIKEWAEGDESMERLLWSCYQNELKTNGSHAGKHPYLGIDYEEENKNKLISLIDTVISEKGARILFSPDGGNPFSGPNWYKPDITFGSNTDYKEEADQLFDKMNESLINDDNQNTNYSSIVNLFDFLIGKYSGINIRLMHTNNDEYILDIGKIIEENDITTFVELNKLFTSVGLINIENDSPRKGWIIKSNNQMEFIEKLNSISENIINNYSLKKPESVEETSSFNIQALIIRDEYIKDGNEKGFDLWLMDEERKQKEAWDKRFAERQNQGKEKL